MRDDVAHPRCIALVEIGTKLERDARASSPRAAAEAESKATGRHRATIVQPAMSSQAQIRRPDRDATPHA
jgi:hypothetical protein